MRTGEKEPEGPRSHGSYSCRCRPGIKVFCIADTQARASLHRNVYTRIPRVVTVEGLGTRVDKTTFRVNRETSGGLFVRALSIDTLQLRSLSLFPPLFFDFQSHARWCRFDRAKLSPPAPFHPLNLSVSTRLCRGSRNS